MFIKFLVLGGGSADFIFMGARIFLIKAYPVRPFLVFEKGLENPPEKQGCFIPTKPLESLQKKAKPLKQKKEPPEEKKNKEL